MDIVHVMHQWFFHHPAFCWKIKPLKIEHGPNLKKENKKKISQKSRNKISPAIHVFTPFQPSLLAARNPWVSCPSPARCRRGRRWTRRALAGFHGENCKALGCQGKDYRIYSIFWKHVFAARTSWRIRLGSSWMQLLGKPEHQCFFISCSVRWFGKG